jgi:DNA-binding winged helix-turn-helix (wHTH) protein
MPLALGPFTVDELARTVWLAGRELTMQPRVFDLLVYLLRHGDRVVTKDELLQALWPGVTVTDNSIQRAVSLLRAHLREGGLTDAVCSVPRAGYRFKVPGSVNRVDSRPADFVSGQLGERARRAVIEQRWREADPSLSTATTSTSGPSHCNASDSPPALFRCSFELLARTLPPAVRRPARRAR